MPDSHLPAITNLLGRNATVVGPVVELPFRSHLEAFSALTLARAEAAVFSSGSAALTWLEQNRGSLVHVPAVSDDQRAWRVKVGTWSFVGDTPFVAIEHAMRELPRVQEMLG